MIIYLIRLLLFKLIEVKSTNLSLKFLKQMIERVTSCFEEKRKFIYLISYHLRTLILGDELKDNYWSQLLI